jgi:hypothetical protein
VDRTDLLACWIWTGRRDRNGYGIIGFMARDRLAHRVAYALTFPEWDGKQNVLHRCDNPPCVNPAHLFLGSQADNVADMIAKGRAHDSRGERAGNVKLTSEQVTAIRAEPLLRVGYECNLFAVGSVFVRCGIERGLELSYDLAQ